MKEISIKNFFKAIKYILFFSIVLKKKLKNWINEGLVLWIMIPAVPWLAWNLIHDT